MYPYTSTWRAGATDCDTAQATANKLNQTFGAIWEQRGYRLTQTQGSWDIVGDEGQFYLDAVANDANAALAMAFLGRFTPESFDQYKNDARDDMIDLEESMDILLLNQSLDARLNALT